MSERKWCSVATIKYINPSKVKNVVRVDIGCRLTLSVLKMDCAVKKASVAAPASAIISNSEDTHSGVEYAVVILSSSYQGSARQAIRNSWMKLANNIAAENDTRVYKWTNTTKHFKLPDFIRVYFVVGIQFMGRHDTMELIYESEEKKDLLLLANVRESNLDSSKKMLRALEWINKNCKNLKYVIKCDQKSFVRIDLIIRDLLAYGPNLVAPELAKYVSYKLDNVPSALGLYWGYFTGKAYVYLFGPKADKQWFQCDHYLPYALSGGYVISQNIVQYIGSNADRLIPYRHEDISMGLWTSALRGINRVHDIRFDAEWKSRGCRDEWLVTKKETITEVQLVTMYKKLISTNGEKLCPVVSEVRKSYRYKWDVPPSMCCA